MEDHQILYHETMMAGGALFFFASLFLLLFMLQLIIRTKKQHQSLSVRRCPNPNCIRCQRYKTVQQSAAQRLPHLIREWQRSITTSTGTSSSISSSKETKEDATNRELGRIIDGVNSGPPPLPNTTSWTFQKRLNAVGQYPTVLFIPRLPVHAIATSIHQHACDLLLASSSIHTGNTSKEVHLSNQEDLMEEYLNSQFNGGEWQNNDAGALHPTNPNQLWEVLYLMNQGKWMKENTRLCSKTYSLMKQLPGLMENCMFGNIFFSVLYPGTSILSHCGPTNVRHRLHFPLLVPSHKDGASHAPLLKVNGKMMSWTENEPFVFDDSLAHAAEYPDNSESEVRVVLVVDLWHPDLTLDERQMISGLYPSVISD